MKKCFLTILIAATALSGFGQRQKKSNNVLDLKNSITDSAIVYPESFEEDAQKLLESWFVKNYTTADPNLNSDDVYVSDEEMIKRLNALPTEIEMPYNQIVRSYIDRYTQKGRSQVSAILGLSLYYMPIFEQALAERGLPLELKYLPVIESSLNPNAVSPMGATGLWQFMLATAKGLGMEVNSLVDERRDPYVSSEMAATFLKQLYDIYGDWSLVIAAYNCGPGNVNKALRRAGGETQDNDFWTIYPYLPAETRGYVPKFIAANYVMNYYPQHHIAPVLPTKPLVIDSIHVSDRIHFNQISKVLDIPIEELRILNPQFRNDLIPGTPDNPYNLILPSQQIHAYLMSEDDIKKYDSAKYAQRGYVDPGEVPADAIVAIEEEAIWTPTSEEDVVLVSGEATRIDGKIVHKVAPGETLASIAQKYNVSAESIKVNNNMRRNAVRVGQYLEIAPDDGTSNAVAQNTTTNSSTQGQGGVTRRRQSTTSNSATAETVSNVSTTAMQQQASAAPSEPTPAPKKTTSTQAATAQNTQAATPKKTTATTPPATKATTAQNNTAAANNNKKKPAETSTNKNNNAGNNKNNNKQTANNSTKNNKKNETEAKGKNNNTNTKKAAPPAPKQPTSHDIKNGDNLEKLSKRYGVTVDELKKANGLKSDMIKAGDKLKIPAKKQQKAANNQKATNNKKK